ncbi:MAG TPA: hypothetical protein VK961_00975 [Chthoniobacter sp.]|nr:hypothetical protein [Chthoniobacter sp.]
MTSLLPRVLGVFAFLALCQWSPLTHAADAPAVSKAEPPKGPAPIAADVSYGPSPNQLVDIFVPPDAKEPCPVLIWYGGIWKPAKHAVDPGKFFPSHIAVVAVETRTLTDGVQEKANPPVSYVMNDAVRAVQFIRLNAAKWNLDPKRIAVGGGSQGTLPALYVGCSGDHANPTSNDPVERVSSQVVCVAAFRSQPTIDPKRMQEWVPGVSWGAPAFGMSFEDSLKHREELLPIIQKWSPDALLNKDAAPIYFENEWGLSQPEDPKITEANYKVHSPAWGMGFKKQADTVGVTVYNKFPDHPTEKYKDIWDFIIQSLSAPAK